MEVKTKTFPKDDWSPTAILDTDGNLLTSDEDIKAEAIRHYQKVFKERDINKDLKHFEVDRENLFQERPKVASQNKTPSWSTEDVTNVLKSLMKGKENTHMIFPMSCSDLKLQGPISAIRN